MPDICMCKGTNRVDFELSIETGVMEPFDCPLRENCKRYLAVPKDKWQSFFVGLPYDVEKQNCEYFWRER